MNSTFEFGGVRKKLRNALCKYILDCTILYIIFSEMYIRLYNSIYILTVPN